MIQDFRQHTTLKTTKVQAYSMKMTGNVREASFAEVRGAGSALRSSAPCPCCSRVGKFSNRSGSPTKREIFGKGAKAPHSQNVRKLNLFERVAHYSPPPTPPRGLVASAASHAMGRGARLCTMRAAPCPCCTERRRHGVGHFSRYGTGRAALHHARRPVPLLQ